MAFGWRRPDGSPTACGGSAPPMAAKKSSYYQSRYRARLREKGFVKREIWIPPQYVQSLMDCQAALRKGVIPFIPKKFRKRTMSQDENWTTETLCAALAQWEGAAPGDLVVELVEGAASPWEGEGYRKVWARLRVPGIGG